MAMLLPLLVLVLLPALASHNRPQIWFQQDGATARQSMAASRHVFRGRVISKYGVVNWPARSPDPTTPDFFLWGYLKSQVFATRPQTLADLKERIRDALQDITWDMLHRVMRAFVRRLEECVQCNGNHLPSVIFKKQ